jgi:predicted ATP-grasp superfamily ATP-dependent carboligase
MKAIGYRGIVDIGFRHDARDGSYKILDVNPRIGATFRLFAGADGTDVARLLYRDLTDQPLRSTAPVEGRKWLDEHRDLFSTRAYRREGSLTISGWLRSLRGVSETAWFAFDDMVPAISMASEVAGRALRRSGQRVLRPMLRPR